VLTEKPHLSCAALGEALEGPRPLSDDYALSPTARRPIPKLAIVTEIIAPYRISVFNALAQTQKVDLRVIFLAENDPGLRQWRVYKDEIKFPYDVLPSWRWRLAGYNVLINRGVFGTLDRIRPDAVLCGGYNYLASWQVARWARRHRVPLLLWTESTAFDQRRGHRLVEFMKSRFLNLCSAFVVPGKSSLEYLQHLGIAEERIFAAPNAVDVTRFGDAADKARAAESAVRARHSLPPRYFLYVGRLVRGKGIFDLVDAYARLSRDLRAKVGLVFVGDGADRAELMQRASRIAPGKIQFAGFVHREELPDYYALADALVLPTYSDPWGLVVNEAMSCGLPVIASSVAGCVADLVQDGDNGFVVSPGNVPQLAAAIARLAEDSALRIEMGTRGKKKIEAYSPLAWAQGLINAVERVCAREL
jgi:glycosyltransferase involved in cell wall biosynthesis